MKNLNYNLCPVYVLKIKYSDVFISDYNISNHSLSYSDRGHALIHFYSRKTIIRLASLLSDNFNVKIMPYKVGLYRKYNMSLPPDYDVLRIRLYGNR